MNFLTKFSNSNGHLIMSIVLIATGLGLILGTTDATMHGIGITLITTSSGYWFASSAAAANNHPPTPTPKGENGNAAQTGNQQTGH